ncbi:hypothetical protein Q8F55_004136 [Vanrija albida]|uniref:Zn(2)-C6 fungal-type domain-containing protein n=1 Tax=Vanrija albida TaxID=181172 RepID=A0ABR3Q710_9TREE
MAAQSQPSTSQQQQQPAAAAPPTRPIVPHLQTNTAQQPVRKDSFPPNTPSALSHVSSPGAPTHSPSVKRPIAPATDAPGAARPPGPERKPTTDGRSQSIVDPATGKKKRISLSCAQCAKRKQKCNREYPCQHCLARKVPELCVQRVERIENVLSVIVRHNPGIGGYDAVREWLASTAFQRFVATAPSTPGSPSNLIPHQLHNPPLPTLLPGPRPKHADGGINLSTDEIERMDKGASSEEGDRVGKGWLGQLEGGVPESMRTDGDLNMQLDVHGTPAENLQRLITDCGVSPHKVQELIQELPPKPFADRVIDWFFRHLNQVRYPIDERLFRTSYEDLYNKTTAVDPANVRALPLVFIVLAMAVRLAPDQWAGDDHTRKISSLRMYWSSRRSILIATAIQSESLELVVTRLLSAMYLVLIHDRRLTECWSQLGASLRTAQAIGLHRDGSKLGLDPFQTEYRRRLWSHLYHADRLYSLILGRPPSISDSYTDSLPPSNVELSDYDLTNPNTPLPVSKPLSEPTTATFLILRRHLSQIIGRIVHHFQKLNEPAQYSDVQKLQEELDGFNAKLPPHFRMRDPDKSLDRQLYWLPVHRFMLLTEVLVTTIILHRPWLLRRLSSNRYQASRTACFESAKLDFQIRQDFQREVPNYWLYSVAGQFKMFNSAMIAGISAIIDPRGSDADFMRRILTTFLEQHPWSEVSQLDETTRKEVQIIHTLSRRAAQIYEDTMAPGELNAQDKDSVALLLALRQQGENYANSFSAEAAAAAGAAPTPRPPTATGSATPRAPPVASWARYMNPQHAGLSGFMPGVQPSPASSAEHEEDHSQRLLDHWLSNNATLSVGLGGGAANLDAGLYGSSYNFGAATPGVQMTPGGFPPPPPTPSGFASTPNLSSLGFMGWGGVGGTPTDDPMSAASTTLDTSVIFPPSAGLDGSVLGVANLTAGAGGDATQESSDEYWDKLIDNLIMVERQ